MTENEIEQLIDSLQDNAMIEGNQNMVKVSKILRELLKLVHENQRRRWEP